MPKYINTEYDIATAFQAIEEELIASMMRNMDRHRAEETELGIEWTQWQAEQLKSLEKYKKQNQKKYSKRFADINKQAQVLIREARSRGNMEQEIQIMKAIQRGYRFPNMPNKLFELLEEMDGKTFRQKASLLLKRFMGKDSAQATAEFFKLNDRKLEALIKATTNDMQKAETAVLRMANDQYRKIIYNAQVYANTGAGTYEKAVDMAAKDFLSRGLTCVEYANGARHTLADYADMAIRTASKRAYLQGEGEKRKEWGISTVIVNKRGNPCPKCLPFCGKVLIDDVWSGGSRKDGKYPLMSTAIAKGLYHPRCKDSHTTYFPGISTADDTWTKEELQAVEKAGKKEAERQYATRQAARFERLAAYSLDDERREQYSLKEQKWKSLERMEQDDIIGLSEEEVGALQRYKSFDSYMLNEAIRSVDDIENLSVQQKHFIETLDSALSKIKIYNGNLVRTVDFSDWPDAAERSKLFLEEFVPGTKMRVRQYWSTSKASGYSEGAGIKIFIQDAKKGRDISSIGLDEKEVLYERDNEFLVISKVLHEGIWYILLKEV